jgi:hypothetical protein
MKYEIQTYCLCGGWSNVWSIEDESGEYTPEYFDTYEKAKEALNTHFEEIAYEVKQGNLESEDDPEDFRIMEVA